LASRHTSSLAHEPVASLHSAEFLASLRGTQIEAAVNERGVSQSVATRKELPRSTFQSAADGRCSEGGRLPGRHARMEGARPQFYGQPHPGGGFSWGGRPWMEGDF